jgi:GNAT superfamily N-acetyltransferase
MFLFKVTNIGLDHCGRVVNVPELTLGPGSRVHASGEAGHIARKLLRGELQLVSDGDGRGGEYTPPRIRHLSPKEIDGSYADATQLPWDDPNEVILLEECLELRDRFWTTCFGVLLSSAKLESFAGAVVICTSNDARSMSPVCSESWILLGSRMLQEPCLEVFEDALNSDAADELIQQCREVDYCNLSNWMNDATKKDGTVVMFAARESDGSLGLRGFLSYRMIESRSEFHVAFIFVPREFRKGGYGGRLVKWAISKAQRMPKSKCCWVSLEAADDDLVTWYEKFGFTDMTCGHDDDPEALIWMEKQNSPMVNTPMVSMNGSPTVGPLAFSLSRQSSACASPAQSPAVGPLGFSRQSSPSAGPAQSPTVGPLGFSRQTSPFGGSAQPSPMFASRQTTPKVDFAPMPRAILEDSPILEAEPTPAQASPSAGPVSLSSRRSSPIMEPSDAVGLLGVLSDPPISLSRQTSGQVSITVSDAEEEGVERRRARKGSLRLSFGCEDGTSGGAVDAQPSASRHKSRISSRFSEVRDEEELSKKVCIPRELWTQVADEL